MANMAALKAKLHAAVPAFARQIAPVYQGLGWTWTDHDTDQRYIPTIAELVRTLHRLIDDLSDEPPGPVSWTNTTGGLEIWIEGSASGLRCVCDEMMIEP